MCNEFLEQVLLQGLQECSNRVSESSILHTEYLNFHPI